MAGSQKPGEVGGTDATLVAMVELLQEQLKAQQSKQEMPITSLEQ